MAAILLVDDDALVARLYARAVAAAGHDVTIAADGDAALDAVAASPPALIVSDVQMPRRDGLSLAAALRERRARIPLVLMSADDDAGLVAAGLAAGADDFVVKGVGFAALAARVDWWLAAPGHGLPRHIRAAAAAAIERARPPSPVARLHGDISPLIARAARTVAALLRPLPDMFGAHDVEALRLLGVADGVVATLARSNALAQLRRLEALAGVAAALPAPHGPRLAALLPRLDRAADDATFRHAAATLVLTRR